ncbi:glucan biosynthesis protein [Aestuariibius sp. 2305UL40-4]|uniref:glucan biosynthesis protein n=1 Tax=Aestuariibius violaceus TaxID=3234132 RepID=UPI00345E1729
MKRRTFLQAATALAATPLQALADEPGLTLGDPVPFTHDGLIARARAMADEPYRPRPTIPQAWQDLSYDQFRHIWFDHRNALFTETDAPLRVDLFPPGLYFPQAVACHVIEDGQARQIAFDKAVFDTTDQFPDLPMDDTLGFTGLRLRAELETPGIFQEFAVFQGASYFRAIGTGDIYGLSARGLAIDTAEPSGEEFPDFTAFWLERPAPGSDSFVLCALLDSPSVTGAYRFEITPGAPLSMEVDAALFPRRDIRHIGIAPLTSMFLFDETMRDRFSDFRPAVHDNDGLLIANGAGEVIWRPLANPRNLQISAFADTNPRGFGLMQRSRRFSDFADLEALYHRRPGLWITPHEDWGPGAVTLIEIPADLEIYDNIVAYWRPASPYVERSEHRLTYRLDWGEAPAPDLGLAKVINTRIGGRPEGGLVVAIDFEPRDGLPDLDAITPLIRSSVGETTPGLLQRNPETGGPRLAFTFRPGDATLAEFRVQLRSETDPLSEVWLYRWTA